MCDFVCGFNVVKTGNFYRGKKGRGSLRQKMKNDVMGHDKCTHKWLIIWILEWAGSLVRSYNAKVTVFIFYNQLFCIINKYQ